MSATENDSYFSRFFLKFIEIVAAGLATAVSGYLIAHLTGVLTSPVPAPVAAVSPVAPSPSAVSSPSAQTSPSIANSGSNTAAQVTPAISANANEQRPAQLEVNTPSLPQPTRKTVNPTKAELARKPVDNAATAATGAREQNSFLSRVRAALTNVDANRAQSPLLPHANAIAASTAIPQPHSAIDQAGAVSRVPSGASGSPPAQQSPTEPNPSNPLEIKSRSVVDAQSPPAPPAEKEAGVLSALEQILRNDPLRAADDVPRPPMLVGQ
jgi:hypothetical protein